jgi:hypothetical protein
LQHALGIRHLSPVSQVVRIGRARGRVPPHRHSPDAILPTLVHDDIIVHKRRLPMQARIT